MSQRNRSTYYIKPYHWRLEGKWKEIHLSRLKFVKKYIKCKDHVLDVGCGDGYLTNLLSSSVMQVVGVDTSFSALSFAKEMVKGVHFILASALNLPFIQQCFDVAVAIEVIEHLDPTEVNRFISEVHQSLRKGVNLF